MSAISQYPPLTDRERAFILALEKLTRETGVRICGDVYVFEDSEIISDPPEAGYATFVGSGSFLEWSVSRINCIECGDEWEVIK